MKYKQCRTHKQTYILFLFFFTLLLQFVISRVGVSTTYDGVLPTVQNNTYLKFSGNTGLFYKDDQVLAPLTSYSLSIWIRPQQTPQNISRNMKFLTVKPNGFECSLTQSQEVRCQSDISGGTADLSISSSEVRLYNWYILTIRTKSGQTQMQLREMSFDVVLREQTRATFFPGGNSFQVAQITIGLDDDQRSDGFIGNIRNLKVLNGYLDDSTLKRAQYTFLYPYVDLVRIQLTLNSLNDIQNFGSSGTTQILSPASSIDTDVEYTPAVSCWIPTEKELQTQRYSLLKFSNQMTLNDITFSQSMTSTALQAWVLKTAIPSQTSDQTLFSHLNVLDVSFPLSSPGTMLIRNSNRTSMSATFSNDRWVFIEIQNAQLNIQVSIYDNNGVRYFYNQVGGRQTQISSSNTIQIGTSFQGFILGLKYYRDSNIQNLGPSKFTLDYDTNYFTLFYFHFTQQGSVDQSGSRFKNYVQSSFASSIDLKSGTIQFVKDYPVRQYPGSLDTNGMIPSQYNFDGVTCIDNKEKLFFPSSTSSASVSIKNDGTFDSYSLEFWFRPTQSLSNEAMMINLLTDQRTLNLVIKAERNQSLSCYSAFTQNSKQAISYLDFSYQNLGWMHVSCIYDLENLQQKGTLYINNADYAYYSEFALSSQASTLKQSTEIKLNINTDPINGYTKGAAQVFYSEVRFWKQARTVQQIKSFKFHQIDPISNKDNLLSYLKLLSGSLSSNGYSQVTDLVQPDIKQAREITQTNDLQWISQSDVVFCPLGLFKGEAKTFDGSGIEQVCYREGIVSFNVLTYQDTNMGGYVITTLFSKFRNAYAQANFNSLYNFQWSLNSVSVPKGTEISSLKQSFAQQSLSNQLFISYTDLLDLQTKLDISINVQDTKFQQDAQSTTIKLNALKCANIFDTMTSESLVYMDLDSVKGLSDIVFQYSYTDCSDFKLDQNQMSFIIDNDRVQLSSGDHNPKLRTFTLRTIQQANLPMNEYFFLKIKGVWKNSKNIFDTPVEFSLIYGCRFIEKLVITLQPNLLTVLKGQTLTIDHKASYQNINMIGKDRTYRVKWTCPGRLNEFCQSIQSDSLKINFADVLNSGIEFWKPHTITMTAYTNFIQGDGLKQSNRSIDVTWINVNSDARMNVQGTKNYTKNSMINLQVTVPGLSESQIQVQWTLNPSIPINKTCIPNTDTRKQFNINPRCLSDQVQYNASCNILYSQQQQVVWSGFVLFSIPKSPYGGTLNCLPASGAGIALITSIKCTAANWKVASGSPRYQFLVKNNKGEFYAISQVQGDPSFTSLMPQATQVAVKVIDQYDQATILSINYTIAISVNSSLIWDYVKRRLDLGSFTKTLANTDLMQELQLLSSVYWNQSTLNQTQQAEFAKGASDLILFQAKNFSKQLSQEQKRYMTVGILQISNVLSSTSSPNMDAQVNLQEALNIAISSDSSMLDYLYSDPTLTKMFFDLQNSIMSNIQSASKRRLRILQNTTSFTQNNTENSLTEEEIQQLQNMSAKVRQFLIQQEQYLSKKLGESEEFNITTSAFNFSVRKFSRMSVPFENAWFTDPVSKMNLQFPLQTAIMPTDRQSLSMITFKDNPYSSTKFLNQTPTSKNAMYFAYRDENGKYMSNDFVPGRINMSFPFTYSPFVFLPNVTVCGYIGIEGSQWENSSCITIFDRANSRINCSCQHMSFYSVIDDYLERPQKLPIIQLTFKNWSAFIAILYVIILFIVGVIYSYNKDNQDFRYLHEQDEMQGNVESEIEGAVSLVSLAFKRKVFFMDFNEEYSYWTLYRLYTMLLHPIFQLKYRMDPHIPRFYKFLSLFTRINISFGLTFFLMRNLYDGSSSALTSLVIFIFCGSFLYLPLPISIFTPFKSRYYLLKPQSATSMRGSDYEPHDPHDLGDPNQQYYDDELDKRITDVEIDASIPIKLLFLVNALPIEKIVEDNGQKLSYCTGDPHAVGEKLLELDEDYLNRREEANKKPSKPEGNHQIHNQSAADGAQIVVPTQQNLMRGSQSQRQSERHPEVMIEQIDKQEDSESNLKSSPIRKRQTLPKGDALDVSQIIFGDEENENIDNPDEEIVTRQSKNQRSNDINQKRPHGHSSSKQIHYEGGEREPNRTIIGVQRTENQNNQDNQPTEESDFSIDTNLFLDEKKEMIEFTDFFMRAIGGFLTIGLNGGIIVAVIQAFIKEGFYNTEGKDTWVIAFFASQLVGFVITTPLSLMVIAAIVSKWCRFRKVFLARWFRESLYIYEDYQFVVKFAKTKIS